MTFVIYAVRNDRGEWFRAVGYGGGGRSWVTDIADAKLYIKLGQARSRVTYFANAYPERKPPEIVAFVASSSHVLEEDERVAKAKQRKAEAEAKRQRYEARQRLKSAQETIERAEAEIRRLREVSR